MVESESEVTISEQEPAQEEMIAKSRVNKIVKREKAAAADKVRREMEAKHASELESFRHNPEHFQQNPENYPQDPQAQFQNPVDTGEMQVPPGSQIKENDHFDRLFDAKLKKLQEAEQERMRLAEEAETQRLTKEAADKYLLKVSQQKADFPDFDEVMKEFDMTQFSGLALLAGQMDNTAAIMHELASNPSKVAQLQFWAERSSPMALREMQKLSASIAKNQQAAANNVPTNAPLSRLKSSTVAGADNGQMGLKDFKNADWLKG
jgi:hypothetical protein